MGVDVEQVLVTGADWRGLLGRIRHDGERISDRLVVRLSGLPSYATLPPDHLRPSVVATVQALVDALHVEPLARGNARRGPSGHGIFRELGAQRARQGVSAGDLVHGWHAACEEIVRRAREVLPDSADADHLLVQLYARMMSRLDAELAAMTEGHRAAELDRSSADQHARGNLVRAVLSDRLPPAAVQRRAEQFRLDRTARYHAVRARPTPAVDAATIEQELLGTAAGRPGRGVGNGVLALVDNDVCGFVQHLPVGPVAVDVAVGVAGPVTLHELPGAFRTATRLLEASVALGRTGLVDLDCLGLEAAVVTDDDVGEAMLARYVRPLECLGPAGELVLDTVARYLGNDGRLDTTARELHVHVNTVRYRLGRFEQVTERSLRSTETLVQVWWALRRRSISTTRTAR